MTGINKYCLELIRINKSFSNVQVLEDINLTLRYNSVLGIVGENGAGKSTLMNIIGGVVKSDSGNMFLEGQKYQPNNPRDAENSGISFIHQELSLFTNLSVKENIYINSLPINKFGKIKHKKVKKDSKKLMDEIGININVDSLVANLSISQRQMVEIIKALAKKVKIVIFDEPTTSLSEKEKIKLFGIISEIKKKNISVIYISHVLDDVFRLCDEIVVLRDGRLIGQHIKNSLDKKSVIKMMVGREIKELFPYKRRQIGDVVLKINNLKTVNLKNAINIELHAKEILGIFGLMGSGRTELADAIFGIDKILSGKIYLKNKEFSNLIPKICIDNSMAYVTENRHEEGLLLTKSIKHNLTLASLKKISRRCSILNKNKESSLTSSIIKKLKIKTTNNEQLVQSLSGGNQQKVVLGKWLLTEPQIIILDEPTRGVDVGAKVEIYNYIIELATNGSAFLFISSEMEELLGICDRILVMGKSQITSEILREDFSQENIMSMALGGELINGK